MTGSQLTLADVLAGTGGELRGAASPRLPLSAVCPDSRAVQPGALFVALRGRKHDGHAFVAEAFARGASAALVERVPAGDVLAEDSQGPPLVLTPSTLDALRSLARYWIDRHRAAAICIAGSVGKATAAELAAAVLSQRFEVLRAAAVKRPELAVPLALLRLRRDGTRIVLELGLSGDPDLAHLTGLVRPAVVAITNVQRNRLEPAVPLDELARPKAALVAALPAAGTAVLNADDELVRAMASPTGAAPIFYGLGPAAEVRAEGIVGRGLKGIEFDLAVARRNVHVRLPLLGLTSVHSALAAAAIGLADGLELREIGAGLQTASAAPRIIAATGLNGSRIIDDSYNASPESTLEALNLVAQLGGHKVAVLGDMLGLGCLEVLGHRKVGNRAALVCDALVTVGERARWIADEARRVGLPGEATFEARTNAQAIDYLRRRLRPGDVVLVKGSPEVGMQAIVQAIRLEG
jgi:UDP-N-acetylmuramoyl-tripeptide--D-alanyl-D-alanine ligase